MVKSNIRILADENIASGLVKSLRNAEYDVCHVAEISPGINDDGVLELAYREERALITEDKDFGDLVYRLNKPALSVILLRIPDQHRQLKLERLLTLLENYASKIDGSYVVVELNKIRFRPLIKSK